jgi:hypothetical protein
MFIAVLVTIAKLWNQPGCPPVNEQIKNNEAYMHNGVLFSHQEEWNYVVCRKK